jgi:hypothetical protein
VVAPLASSTPPTEQKPLAAAVLIVVGGVLLLFEGLIFAEGVLVALVTFFFGSGGFYLGGILAGIGGVPAMLWIPRPLPSPVSLPFSTPSAPPPPSC